MLNYWYLFLLVWFDNFYGLDHDSKESLEVHF